MSAEEICEMKQPPGNVSIINDCEVVQRFVDRNIADGLQPQEAFEKAFSELRMICEFNWHAIEFDSKTKTVLARTEVPASTSTVIDRTPSEDGRATQ